MKKIGRHRRKLKWICVYFLPWPHKFRVVAWGDVWSERKFFFPFSNNLFSAILDTAAARSNTHSFQVHFFLLTRFSSFFPLCPWLAPVAWSGMLNSSILPSHICRSMDVSQVRRICYETFMVSGLIFKPFFPVLVQYAMNKVKGLKEIDLEFLTPV